MDTFIHFILGGCGHIHSFMEDGGTFTCEAPFTCTTSSFTKVEGQPCAHTCFSL